MKQLMKTKIAAVAGSVLLAATLSAPANAAIVLGGDNGWEVSYGGFINLFYTQSSFENPAGTATTDSAHLNEGLLPAFHTLTAKSPEINGLKGTAQITFAVDASGNKDGRLNKAGVFNTGSRIDMREVFFNVEGDFGTISVGNTLSLFMRQSILKDYTLFGVGALAGPDGAGTALGRIGFGYVYPDFRTRFTYKTPDINGFNLEVGVFDPQEPLGANATTESDTPQFQAEANYNTTFQGGTFNLWAGMLWQEQTLMAATGNASVTSFGFNVGADVTFGGFNVMGTYYTGQALGTTIFNLAGTGDARACTDNGSAVIPAAVAAGPLTCDELDDDGFIVQAAYTFNGKTKVGISYGESTEDASAAYGIAKKRGNMYTVGVYHDVNSWLKVVAEYSQYQSDLLGLGDSDTFSIGGFILW